MNERASFQFRVMAVLLITLSSAGAAAAQTNTKLGTGALGSDTTGYDDTGLGYYALSSNTTGALNTATGLHAQQHNNTQSDNTATGTSALRYNTKGYNNNPPAGQNTATGLNALFSLTTDCSTVDNLPCSNTAMGADALFSSAFGFNSIAIGVDALFEDGSNQDDSGNVAIGASALRHNIQGFNAAAGANALFPDQIAFDDTAIGASAAGGFKDTAIGVFALSTGTNGYDNTASGFEALYANTTGAFNIALGYQAGRNLTTGTNNIDIGAPGVAAESNTIRIGVQDLQSATYIAGISGTGVTGPDVVVNSSGQLGFVMSSARYKRDIRDMGEASSGLMKLRPVTFRYKNDRTGAPQYGLVAEEVERVYPELVSYGADGQLQSMLYSMLTPMLLNEMQKQARRVRDRARQLRNQAITLQELTVDNQRLARQLAILSARSDALKTSAGQALAELSAKYEQELRSVQKRLATIEQAMRTVNGGEAGRGGVVR